MSEWYLCTNMFYAVDAYDQLGVPPGPSDLGSTPIQRVMKLSTVPKQHIDDCYARTMESVEKDSNEAKQIAEAYALLQGEARKAYDMKLLGAVSVSSARGPREIARERAAKQEKQDTDSDPPMPAPLDPPSDCDSVDAKEAIAVQAAMQFEKITFAVLDEFDTLKRTPHQRKAMLDAHGLGVTYNKKSIAVQRTALARALSDCESQLVENDILTNVWKDLNNKEALDKSSIVHCKGGFAATFNGSQQKVEQIFKSLKAASDWVAQMNKADKDCE
ncbi:unnamed protein product, partial [Durusdinium trenchii]